MEEDKTKQIKMPFYKKAIGVSIMIAVAVYCVPELQEKMFHILNAIKNEWRKQR